MLKSWIYKYTGSKQVIDNYWQAGRHSDLALYLEIQTDQNSTQCQL